MISRISDQTAIKDGAKIHPELLACDRPILFSHNFCDKTTWYAKSTRVTGETLDVIPATDNKQFQADNTVWVDLSHGKVCDEDNFSSSYLPVIKVDGVTKTEATPFGDGTDGDFTIDYDLGKVIFHNSVTGTVTADYSWTNNSTCVFTPNNGKVLEIIRAEAQLSSDIVMNDTIQYSIFVDGTPVRTKKYKTIVDLVAEGNKAYPIIPSFGGASRGMPSSMHIVTWDYLAKTQIRSSLNMKVEIEIANDIVCGGSYAVVAFYCHSEAE